MNVDLYKSMVYDTVRYFETYFNKNQIEQETECLSLDIEQTFKNYNTISENCTVRNEYMALFEWNENRVSFLCELLFEYYEKVDSTEALKEILMQKRLVISKLSKYFLSKDHIETKDIFNMNGSSNIKISLALIINNYEGIIEGFFSDMDRVGLEIKKLYKNEESIIDNFSQDSSYEKIAGAESGKGPLCISLIDPYLFKFSGYVWVLGYKYKEVCRENDLSTVTFKSVTENLSNDLVMDIIKILSKAENLTISEIFFKLNIEYSQPALYRAVNNMTAEKIIYANQIDKKTRRYSLNRTYFKYAVMIIYNRLKVFC